MLTDHGRYAMNAPFRFALFDEHGARLSEWRGCDEAGRVEFQHDGAERITAHIGMALVDDGPVQGFTQSPVVLDPGDTLTGGIDTTSRSSVF